jgi:hypothetical protein
MLWCWREKAHTATLSEYLTVRRALGYKHDRAGKLLASSSCGSTVRVRSLCRCLQIRVFAGVLARGA